LACSSLADVAALRARFVHRQPGSGTRLLLEHLCQQAAAWRLASWWATA
jgi:molybdate-binding protein